MGREHLTEDERESILGWRAGGRGPYFLMLKKVVYLKTLVYVYEGGERSEHCLALDYSCTKTEVGGLRHAHLVLGYRGEV